jgi:NAD(P)-dependent dehydrogenase (short-subunit alcohol dehydrogenase family)
MMPKVALVTGASRRIGLVIAQHLGRQGYRIVIHCSEASIAEAKTAVTAMVAEGIAAAIVCGDLSDPAAAARIIAEAGQSFGPLGLLVNSAALFEEDSAFAIDLALWEQQFAVNLRAPVLLAQHFVRQVPEGSEAAIVNIIDQRVLKPTPQFFSYSLTKAALWAATRAMAQAYAPQKIRVNGVGPGPVLPNTPQGDAGFKAEVAGLPLQHAVTPQEIAAAVFYLAEAPSVTGQMLAVDAGQHLAWETPDVVKKQPAG